MHKGRIRFLKIFNGTNIRNGITYCHKINLLFPGDHTSQVTIAVNEHNTLHMCKFQEACKHLKNDLRNSNKQYGKFGKKLTGLTYYMYSGLHHSTQI